MNTLKRKGPRTDNNNNNSIYLCAKLSTEANNNNNNNNSICLCAKLNSPEAN
jgi:hypothetical protein